MSIEGLVGTAAAFDIDIHNARPHKGQIKAGFHRHTNAGQEGLVTRLAYRFQTKPIFELV